jgi:hypothetical protein
MDTLTINVGDAPADDYTINLTGTDSTGNTATAQVDVDVTAGFTLAATPQTLTVAPGGSTTTVITAQAAGSESGNVNLVGYVLDGDGNLITDDSVTVSFSPTAATIGSASGSIATVSVASSVQTGSTYTVLIRGTDASGNKENIEVPVSVSAPGLSVTGGTWKPSPAVVNEVVTGNATAKVTSGYAGGSDNVDWATTEIYYSPSGAPGSFVPYTGSYATAWTQGLLSTQFAQSFPTAGYYIIEMTATDTIKNSSGTVLGTLSGTGYIGGSASDISTGGTGNTDAIVASGSAKPMAGGTAPGTTGLAVTPPGSPLVTIQLNKADGAATVRNGDTMDGQVSNKSATETVTFTLVATDVPAVAAAGAAPGTAAGTGMFTITTPTMPITLNPGQSVPFTILGTKTSNAVNDVSLGISPSTPNASPTGNSVSVTVFDFINANVDVERPNSGGRYRYSNGSFTTSPYAVQIKASVSVSPSGTNVPSGFTLGVVQFADSYYFDAAENGPTCPFDSPNVTSPSTIENVINISPDPATGYFAIDSDLVSDIPFYGKPVPVDGADCIERDKPNQSIKLTQVAGSVVITYKLTKAHIKSSFTDWCTVYDPTRDSTKNNYSYLYGTDWSLNTNNLNAGWAEYTHLQTSMPKPDKLQNGDFPTETANDKIKGAKPVQTLGPDIPVPASGI